MVKIENIQTIHVEKVSNKSDKLLKLVAAGILGTLAFNLAMYADITITGIPLDITKTLGQLVVGENQTTDLIGHTIHIVNGIGLTLFFGYVFLPISKKIMKGRIWIHGITFGVIVTVVTVWSLMMPALGAGFAGLNVAPEVPAMTMFRHIVFGLVIGIVLRNEMN
jgi:hypothetical protein